MKKNGFAISAILYSLLALFILTILTIFILLNTKKATLNAINREIILSIDKMESGKPTISFNDNRLYSFVGNDINLMNGVYAFDSNNNDITSFIKIENGESLDKNTVGEYELIYRVTDNKGNQTSVSRKIIVIDNVDIALTQNSLYIDINITDNSNYIKYFVYRVNKDGVNGNWQGVDIGFNNPKYTILKNETPYIEGDSSIKILDNTHYLLTFDYYSKSKNNNLEVNINNYYNKEIKATINKNMYSDNIIINNTNNQDLYLNITNPTNDDDIYIENMYLYPIKKHSINLETPGYYQVEVKAITIDDKEITKTSGIYTIN